MGFPLAIALTPEGHLVVSEWFPNRVREYSQAGEVLGTIGTGQIGLAEGLATDSDGTSGSPTARTTGSRSSSKQAN